MKEIRNEMTVPPLGRGLAELELDVSALVYKRSNHVTVSSARIASPLAGTGYQAGIRRYCLKDCMPLPQIDNSFELSRIGTITVSFMTSACSRVGEGFI